MTYSDMTTLLKLADKIESQLRKYAQQAIVQQLNDLVSAAYAVFQYRNEIRKHVDSGDMYGKINSDTVLKLVDSMYFAASGMKNDALTKGLHKNDMASRKNRILSLCDQASKFLQANGVPAETVASLGLNLVRAKAEELVPATVPALQPAAPAAPSAPSAPAAPAPVETGVATTEQDFEAARRWYTEPTDEELQGALDLLRPKNEFDQAGIRVTPFKDVPEEYY